MKISSLFILACFVLGGCFPSSQDLYDLAPRFKTTESSVLFFRNTRSVFYDFTEKPEASIEIFRPKTPTAAPGSPGYTWFIAFNRLQSKVLVFFDATPSLKKDPCVEIQWHWSKPGGVKESVAKFSCPSTHPEENFQFLVRSYRQIEAGREPMMKLASGRLAPMFHEKENQRRFLRLIRDFLELVDLV